MRHIAVSSILLILLLFTTPFTSNILASVEDTPIRPAWIKAGDYVTYLYNVTALGISETIHIKEIIMEDSGTYLNKMRTERFGEQNDPDFPLSHLTPSVEEAGPNRVHYDPSFLISKDELASFQSELVEVRGLNNRTYVAYKILVPEVFNKFGDLCECNRTYWFEKETLVKVKQLEWSFQEGLDVWTERIIEESNIPQLTSTSQSTELAKTVTTTIFVNSPKTTVTTTVTITATVTKLQSTNLTSLAPPLKAPPNDMGDGPIVTTTVTIQEVSNITLLIATLIPGVVLTIVAGWIIIRKRR